MMVKILLLLLDVITSDMAADPVSLSDMPVCTVNSIRHVC